MKTHYRNNTLHDSLGKGLKIMFPNLSVQVKVRVEEKKNVSTHYVFQNTAPSSVVTMSNVSNYTVSQKAPVSLNLQPASACKETDD